jgi:tRNA1(Val) A37 N6-methylase TrmN6
VTAEGRAEDATPLPGILPGTLLGGRVRHNQPARGHRTGIEPVLLAASIPARLGQRVLEGGSGAGAALLCLAHRVPGVTGLGIERAPELVRLASANAAANGFTGLGFVAADLTTWQADCVFDHAMANPPWHAPASTASPDSGREDAKRAAHGLFVAWARALAAPLRHRGTLTLVVSAGAAMACLAALGDAGCGGLTLMPLWPRAGREAKLVLLRGVKGARGASRILAGLVLHEEDGRFTGVAQAVLREGAALEIV